MTEKKDYYKILEVSEKATQDEIKKSFRAKSKENHPDLHPGDLVKEAKFKDIAEANSILSDKAKRAKYDLGDQSPFENPFGRRGNPANEINLSINVPVSLDDYINGKEITVSYQRYDFDGKEPVKCMHCNGKGYQTMYINNNTFNLGCSGCGGKGVSQTTIVLVNSIKLQIVYGNLSYVIPGQGSVIENKIFGSLQIVVGLKSTTDLFYDIETGNISRNIKVSLKDYLNGCDVIIPHHVSKLQIKHINNGDSVRKYRLASKGIKITNNFVSDLIVTISPKFPLILTEDEQKLVDDLCLTENFNVLHQIP